MNNLKIDFENCYGIRNVEYEFDFTNGGTISIYAPNGVMKTSFAKVIEDLSNEEEPEDEYFPDRETKAEVLNENDNKIPPERFYVIKSDHEDFEREKTSTLLANKKLRKEYADLVKEIKNSKSDVIKKLTRKAGLGRSYEKLEKILLDVFEEDSFFEAIEEMNKNLIEDNYFA